MALLVRFKIFLHHGLTVSLSVAMAHDVLSASQQTPYVRELWKIAWHIALFLGYLGICAAFYCNYEGWIFSESIMFSLATMTTIG